MPRLEPIYPVMNREGFGVCAGHRCRHYRESIKGDTHCHILKEHESREGDICTEWVRRVFRMADALSWKMYHEDEKYLGIRERVAVLVGLAREQLDLS